MNALHGIIRRAAWRFPRLAQWLWLWTWAGPRVQLIVELTQAAAARLDHAAVLGLGHDRDGLVLAYRLKCGCMHRPDCQLCTRLDALRQHGVAHLIAQTVRDEWRVYAPRGQEDLYDAHGHAPGVYEFDVQSELAILAALDAWEQAQAVAAKTPSNARSQHRGNGRDARRCQGGVSHPVALHAAPVACDQSIAQGGAA